MRSLVPGTSPLPIETRATCLVIETRYAFRYIKTMDTRPAIVVARFNDLNPPFIDRVQPELVLCPLMAEGFDALDVLGHLRAAEWKTSVGVISYPLPNRRMVERELKAHACGLKVDLIIL